MIGKPRGEYYVHGWNEDLKQLKHYRWIRNQIAHEPGCTEDNMCDAEDVQWLDNFYARIMNQADPLALYWKATQTRPAVAKRKSRNQSEYAQPQYNYGAPKTAKQPSGCGPFVLFICAIIAVLVLVFG